MNKDNFKGQELATHADLAKWCAKGKGQWKYDKNSYILHTHYEYDCMLDDLPLVPDEEDRCIYIRKWGGKWVLPTKKNLGVK